MYSILVIRESIAYYNIHYVPRNCSTKYFENIIFAYEGSTYRLEAWSETLPPVLRLETLFVRWNSINHPN